MGTIISAKNAMKHKSVRKLKTRKVLCEALEERQLMSLTLEVRATDGSSSFTATSVGQVINMEILGIVTAGTVGPNDVDVSTSNPSTFGIEDVIGSVISTGIQKHFVGGDIGSPSVSSGFKSFGYQTGTVQDLNNDGYLDLGGTTPNSLIQGYFDAHASQDDSFGTATSTSNTIVLGTFTYTVRSLGEGGTTDINFVPIPDQNNGGQSGGYNAADWFDGVEYDANAQQPSQASDAIASLVEGAPFVISDPSIIPAPTAVNDSGISTYRGTPVTINELANDDYVTPPNPASVTVVTAAGHGTTSLQSNGSIIYTPAAGYTGTDSFTYDFSDTSGRLSNTATVNITVTLAPPPIAVAVSSTTLRNDPVTIQLASQDTATAPATITPGSIAVVTAPTDGTAVVNSDGSVLYTPHAGFVGTDTFTYTVTDSNVETSNPGTVTVTVNTPTPPTAVNDSFTTSEGAPLSLNVLANDTMGSVAIDPTTVDIDTVPQHGTAVPEANGMVLFTPAGGYIGDDAFTYSVSDTLGEVSNVAVVNVIITAGVPPVASDFNATALTGQATTINVVANVVSGATLTPSTLTTSAPAHGAVTVNTDGTVSYTPTPGFVGSDSFTYSVGNVNGDTSNTATAHVFVGTAISKAKGAAHTVAFTDLAGGLQTVSLNVGTADIYFTGTGTIAVAKNGAATVTGGTVDIQNLALTDTTAASALTMKGLVAKPVNINAITDAAPLGKIVAPSASLQGTATFDGLGSLQLASMNNAGITVGSGVSRMSMTVGAVTSSSLTSDVPITTLKLASWTNSTQGETLSAPSIASLVDTGALEVNVALSLATPRALALGSAKITGAIDGTFTTTSVGNIGTLAVGSVASTWVPAVNNINSFTVKTGGLASNMSAGVIGTLSIGGDLTGNITAASANSFRVTGGINSATLDFTGAGGVKTLTAGGAISTETIKSTGNIGTITAGSISGSTINVGSNTATAFASATAAQLGNGVISSIKVVGKTATFADTDIYAGKVTSASLGTITTDNGGAAFGIATKSISSFAGVFSAGPFHAGPVQLKNDSVLSTYAEQQSAAFGDFAIEILS